MSEPNPNKPNDELLAKSIKHSDPGMLTREELVEALNELLRFRRVARGDSRRAEQVRKLRWAVENALGKIEGVDESIRRLSAQIAGENLNTIAEAFEVGETESAA